MWNVILSTSFKLSFMFLIAYFAGLLVKYKNVKVNYTRKINHFCLFYVPALVDYFFINNNINASFAILNDVLFGFASFIIFIKPVRSKIPAIATAFSSFDRPEDRPYTLLWYASQVIIGYLILVPVIAVYERYHMLNMLDIQILIGIFGDGLAEPIGVRFGKHKYTAHSIFSLKKYVRTLEGSLTVFITSVIVILIFQHSFNHNQFLIALATIPLAMTLAEAISPHTWDDPLMIIIGASVIFLIKRFF